MNRAIQKLLVHSYQNLREVLEVLDKTAQGAVFLVDNEGLLLRVITDGDIRRALLKGYSLHSLVNELPHVQAKVIKETDNPQDAYLLIEQFELDHIPVVDHNNRPVGLMHRRDLSPSILLSSPHLGEQEQQFVQQAFDSNWVAPLGPNVDAFENEIKDYVQAKAAVALSSGTAALHLALVVLGVKPGDIVFCSTFTFVATANAILYQYAKPVFIDSDLESWNMSPQALERALQDAKQQNCLPKAVIIVNLYGQSARYDALCALCNEYNVPIIEDAAESLGASYQGKPSGTLGKIGIFSFNGNKIITTSGGGMLISNDVELADRARFLSTQARDPAPYYEHSTVGYNYRLSNVLAGIGRGQLCVLEARISARQAIFNRYRSAFKDYAGINMMPELPNSRSTHWLSTFVIDPALRAEKPASIIEQLNKVRIEARRTWKPMHLQPLFVGCTYYPHQETFSVSDYLFQQGLCLPSGSNLCDSDIQRVILNIQKVFNTQPNLEVVT